MAVIGGDAGSGLRADVRNLVTTAWQLDPARLVFLVGLLLVGGTLGGASLLLLVPIVNTVAHPGAALQLPLIGTVGGQAPPLWVLLCGFVAVVGLQALVSRTTAVHSVRLQQSVVDHLRHRAFVAVLAARWSFVVELRRSDVIQVITAGSARVGQAVGLLLQAAVASVLAVAGAAVALAVAPGVAAVAIVAVAVTATAQGLGIRPAHRLGREVSERSRHLQAVVVDSLDSLRLVRAHDAATSWVQRLDEAFAGTRQAQLASTERMSTIGALSTVGAAGAAAALVLVSTWAAVPPAEIVVMVVLIARLAGQAQSVVRNVTVLANALPSVGEITRLTDDARAAVEAPAGAGTPGGSGEPPPGTPMLELRNVTYHYASSGHGVTDLTLQVPTGAITVLTGPSGSGKSTTADLALGLLLPQHGEVLAAGHRLGPSELAWWRARVAYVPQETVLVPGSLRENLVWSAGRTVDDTECWAALDRVAAGFARRLPDGLDTVVGDRGIRLSGGERQRVAIARALLRRPALLVLDEATSSLDDDTEAAVLDTIAGLTPAVTVLVVAHRRSTVDAADHVVRLAEGRRAEPVG